MPFNVSQKKKAETWKLENSTILFFIFSHINIHKSLKKGKIF